MRLATQYGGSEEVSSLVEGEEAKVLFVVTYFSIFSFGFFFFNL